MRERTERVLLLGVLALRVGQYVPAGLAALGGNQHGYTRPRLVVGLFAALAVWSVLLLGVGSVRGVVPRWMAVADAVAVMFCAVAVGRACAGDQVVGWANWTVGPLNGAALLAVLYLRRQAAAVAVFLLGCAYLAGIGTRALHSAEAARGAVGNTAVLWAFACAAALFTALSRRQASAADTAHAEALAAEQQRAASEARFAERSRQYRMLHDTVLQTLTGIARGGLDQHEDLVRARCQAEADYLRTLIDGTGADTMPVTIAVALAQAVRGAAGLGLRVNQQFGTLPQNLPEPVVAALTGAVTEALNNVARHAGTGQAYLTAYEDGPRVTVTVTDRGAGFDPSEVADDHGIARSIRARMAAVDGTLNIISTPGEGTSVELAWTA